MDETMTEYTSQDYHQIDQMLEERRTFKEQTAKRDLNKEGYQPKRLVAHNKIELSLPRTSWTPHTDTRIHEIYPIPEDEGGRRTGQQQSYSGNKENIHRKERATETNKGANLPSGGGSGLGGSAGAPRGGGDDDPSDPSGDEGPNRGEEVDTEEAKS